MTAEIRIRRGTAASADVSNPILRDGEPGWEKDTKVFKIGDGVTPWNDLEQIGGTLGNLNDVAIVDAPVDKQVLGYDGTVGKWTPQSPQTSLEALEDVDTYSTAPEDGNVLVWDAAMGLWRPGTGVPKVGAWENDQLVTFAAGVPRIVEGLAVPVSGNTLPGSPQVSLTVTEAMLASASRTDVGFSNILEVVFLFDAAGLSGTTSTTLAAEMSYLGEVVGIATSVNTGTSGRQSLTFYLRGAVVGDVVNFRFRLNGAAHAGVNMVAYTAVCFPSCLFQAAPEVGFYLYQQFITDAALGAVPFSASYPTAPVTANYRFFDDGVSVITSTSQPPEVERPRWVGKAPYGVYNSYATTEPTTRLTAIGRNSAAGAVWSTSHLRTPSQVRFDRIALPPTPA